MRHHKLNFVDTLNRFECARAVLAPLKRCNRQDTLIKKRWGEKGNFCKHRAVFILKKMFHIVREYALIKILDFGNLTSKMLILE